MNSAPIQLGLMEQWLAPARLKCRVCRDTGIEFFGQENSHRGTKHKNDQGRRMGQDEMVDRSSVSSADGQFVSWAFRHKPSRTFTLTRRKVVMRCPTVLEAGEVPRRSTQSHHAGGIPIDDECQRHEPAIWGDMTVWRPREGRDGRRA